MNVLKQLMISTAFAISVTAAQATVLQGAPAHIQSQVDAIEAHGYVVREWKITMLGRYKIEFTNLTDNTEREVVLSATDGSVLRDHTDQHSSNGHHDTNGDGVIDAADDNGHDANDDHGGDHDSNDDHGSDDDSNDDHGSDHDSNDDDHGSDDSNDDHGSDHDSNDDDHGSDHDSNDDDHGSDHDGSDDDGDDH